MRTSRPPRGGGLPAALPALLRATHLLGLALGSARSEAVYKGQTALPGLSEKVVHHTKFARNIYRTVKTPSILFSVYQIGVSVPAAEVVLHPNPYVKEDSD
jgi:hypothetical protein